ncbi:MAG: tRNA (5-methylaminomethyl-2-thiouridine)(34)-methyltransferase MnmD [Neomegalonema sp.]|nr:tRNA (5-methylaminomethyl-2-thiouridine)(34)-methyltransferase MnmD [Neomegalonema sp.]
MSEIKASADADAIGWTENGAPVSRAYDDIFFSLEDGRAETEHVFLRGCGLPAGFDAKSAFKTAELGFGLGLTTACLLQAWSTRPNRPELVITSFEIAPAPLATMRQALAPWPDCARLPDLLAPSWPPQPGRNDIQLAEGARLELYIGDANMLAPNWALAAPREIDAWLLDGFSPAKNPELWGEALLRTVFETTRPGGVFATYAAAGWVRRNLQAVGFDVSRTPGYGRKREMLVGVKPSSHPSGG